MFTQKEVSQIAYGTFLEMYKEEDPNHKTRLVELSTVGFLDGYKLIKGRTAAELQQTSKILGSRVYYTHAFNSFLAAYALLDDSESKADRPVIIGKAFGIILGWIEYVGGSKEFAEALEVIDKANGQILTITGKIVSILKKISPSITFKRFAEAIISITTKKRSQLSERQLTLILNITQKFQV